MDSSWLDLSVPEVWTSAMPVSVPVPASTKETEVLMLVSQRLFFLS